EWLGPRSAANCPAHQPRSHLRLMDGFLSASRAANCASSKTAHYSALHSSPLQSILPANAACLGSRSIQTSSPITTSTFIIPLLRRQSTTGSADLRQRATLRHRAARLLSWNSTIFFLPPFTKLSH